MQKAKCDRFMPSIPDINLADLWCFKKYCDQTGYETEWTLVILPRICLISVVIWKATSSVFPFPVAVLIQTSRCSLDVYSSSQLPQLLCNYFVVNVHWYSSWTWQCYTVIFIFMIVHIWLLRHFNHIKSNVKCIKCKTNTHVWPNPNQPFSVSNVILSPHPWLKTLIKVWHLRCSLSPSKLQAFWRCLPPSDSNKHA